MLQPTKHPERGVPRLTSAIVGVLSTSIIFIYLQRTSCAMRIIFVNPFFDIYGGAEKILLSLAKEISLHNHSIEIYTSWFNEKFREYISGYNIKVITVRNKPRNSPFFGRKFNPFLIHDMMKLSKMIKGECDVLLCNNWPSNIATYYAIKSGNVHPKLNVYVCLEPDHGLYHNELFGKDSSILQVMPPLMKIKAKVAFRAFFPLRKLDRKIVSSQDYVLVLSNNIKNRVKQIFGDEVYNRTHQVLHDLVDITQLYPKKVGRKKYGDSKIILSLGRLEIHPKRPDVTIKMAYYLKKKYTNFKLLMGGTGTLKDYLLGLVKKYKIGDNVVFLGFVEEKDLAYYYNLCDVFIYTGIGETSGPITVLEAMACEKPVVVSKSGGPIEIIKDKKNGLFAQPENAKDFADKIYYLFKNPAKSREISKNGKDTVLEGFTREKLFEHFMEFVKKKISKRQ
jgi:glycosyltransferase involved in cell wall biosynthesis